MKLFYSEIFGENLILISYESQLKFLRN